MDSVLSKTKELKSNMIEKTKDLMEEIPRKLDMKHTSWQNRFVYATTFILIVYFAVMDVLTYFHIQSLPVRRKDPEALTGSFNYFKMLSIKGMMEDQLSCHFNWPTCELFEAATHLSNGYPVVTANSVSVFGAIIAIPAAKLLTLESMTWKRLAILVFVFRLWIDGLDGIVFRMQNLSPALKHTQLSVRHSSGWFVDTMCDFFAAFMFMYGGYRTLRQKGVPAQPAVVLPLTTCPLTTCPPTASLSHPSSPTFERTVREISNRALFIKLIWIVSTIACASCMWDYFVAQYRSVFEVTLPTTEQQDLQSQLMKSGSTFVIFWCWRLLNGVSLINTAYLVIVYDRLWEYIQYLQFYGTTLLLLLAVTTVLHLNSIRHTLGV